MRLPFFLLSFVYMQISSVMNSIVILSLLSEASASFHYSVRILFPSDWELLGFQISDTMSLSLVRLDALNLD